MPIMRAPYQHWHPMNLAHCTLRTLALAFFGILFLTGAANADATKPVTANVKQSLEAKLLSGMRITTLKLEGKRVNINGVSPSNALISQFLRTLTYSPNYTKVELVSLEQKNNAMHFYIIADVQCLTAGGNTSTENLCDKSAVKPASVFKCTVGGKTVFQDRPCAKAR